MKGVSFDEGLARLAVYARDHGNVNPPVRATWLGWNIGIWVRDLRTKKRNGALSPEQIEKAERMGLDWNPPRRRKRKPPKPTREQSLEARLHANLDRLILYWQEHGNINVRQLTGTDEWANAGRFVGRLRMKRRTETLPASVEERATAMGMMWDPPLGRRKSQDSVAWIGGCCDRTQRDDIRPSATE